MWPLETSTYVKMLQTSVQAMDQQVTGEERLKGL